LAFTVWWITAACTVPYSGPSLGGQPPLARSAPHPARFTTRGFGAIASAIGVEAIEMKAVLIAARARFTRLLAKPPAVPETLTKCSRPRGLKWARTCA
jgi:hypothetical protein